MSETSPVVVPTPLPPVLPSAGECFLGVVLANESVDVVTEIEGRIREFSVRPGDTVQRGARLALLDNEALGHQMTIERGSLARIEAEVKSFTAQFDQANEVHNRRLALAGLLSREEAESSEVQLEVARSRLDVAKAERTQAQARLAQLETRLAHLEIRAPFAGILAMRYLDPGAAVTPGTPVVRLISTDASLVRFAMPPSADGTPRVGARVRVEIESLGRSAWGVVESRAPEIDAASDMIFIESRLDLRGPPIPPGAVARVALINPGEETPRCLHPPS